MLRLLNNGTSQLNHLITTDKSFGDYNNVDYKGESSNSKTIFVQSELLEDPVNVYVNKLVMKYAAIESKSAVKQSVATSKSASDSRQKRKDNIFVPICYFCGVKGHI